MTKLLSIYTAFGTIPTPRRDVEGGRRPLPLTLDFKWS